jgi:ABC-2 type transport system permease protein
MKWYKIRALMFRDFRVFKRSKWRFVDFVYFPLTTVIIWGLFAIYSMEFAMEAGLMILVVNVFWSFSYLSQSSTNHMMNEDSYSGSFKQIMVSGISEYEYIVARIFSSAIISAGIMVLMLLVSYFFGFAGLFEHSGVILTLTIITLIASISLSVIVATLIIMLGRTYGFLAWTLLQAFILLSAPFFPLDILPEALRYVALVMPYTRVFASVRDLVGVGFVSNQMMFEGFIVALVYLIVAFPLYSLAFRRARKTGELVRMA